MVPLRAIFASLIAISLSLPLVGNPPGHSARSEMAMATDMDVAGCPHCDDYSKNSFACVLKCINVVAILPTMVIIPPQRLRAVDLPLVKDKSRGHATTPPTPPPRAG